jgi:hypothetical protein
MGLGCVYISILFWGLWILLTCYCSNLSKLLNFVNNKISQNTQFAIPPVKMNELLQDLLNLNINKSTVRFSTQEVKNLLKVFAISIDLSTFRSFSVTSLWGLIWFDGFRLCI